MKFLVKFFTSVFGTSLIKIMVITGIVSFAISFGVNYYKTSVAESQLKLNAAISAAHLAGIAETQKNVANTTNIELTKEIQQITQLETETNSKIDKINVDSNLQKRIIISYDPVTIGKEHPEEVEKWANQTTNGIFTDIAGLTQ
jgi:hypothetical protein